MKFRRWEICKEAGEYYFIWRTRCVGSYSRIYLWGICNPDTPVKVWKSGDVMSVCKNGKHQCGSRWQWLWEIRLWERILITVRKKHFSIVYAGHQDYPVRWVWGSAIDIPDPYEYLGIDIAYAVYHNGRFLHGYRLPLFFRKKIGKCEFCLGYDQYFFTWNDSNNTWIWGKFTADYYDLTAEPGSVLFYNGRAIARSGAKSQSDEKDLSC